MGWSFPITGTVISVPTTHSSIKTLSPCTPASAIAWRSWSLLVTRVTPKLDPFAAGLTKTGSPKSVTTCSISSSVNFVPALTSIPLGTGMPACLYISFDTSFSVPMAEASTPEKV